MVDNFFYVNKRMHHLHLRHRLHHGRDRPQEDHDPDVVGALRGGICHATAASPTLHGGRSDHRNAALRPISGGWVVQRYPKRIVQGCVSQDQDIVESNPKCLRFILGMVKELSELGELVL